MTARNTGARRLRRRTKLARMVAAGAGVLGMAGGLVATSAPPALAAPAECRELERERREIIRRFRRLLRQEPRGRSEILQQRRQALAEINQALQECRRETA